jgi:hypothetical protein
MNPSLELAHILFARPLSLEEEISRNHKEQGNSDAREAIGDEERNKLLPGGRVSGANPSMRQTRRRAERMNEDNPYDKWKSQDFNPGRNFIFQHLLLTPEGRFDSIDQKHCGRVSVSSQITHACRVKCLVFD